MKLFSFPILLFALALLLVTPARAETTEEAFLKLAKDLPYISYHDVLINRPPDDHTPDRQVTRAWETLQAGMRGRSSYDELSSLAGHADPKVRTLALLGLYQLEQPRVFRILHAHSQDHAPTVTAEALILGRPGGDTAVYTQPITVAKVANQMLARIGFQAPSKRDSSTKPDDGGNQAFEDWSRTRLDNPEWLGWYEFLYLRARGGTNPPPPRVQPRIDAFRQRLAGLPPPVRAWFWLMVADECLSLPRYDTPLATEAEIVEAARGLGSKALLAFLRDGSRAGLREPNSSKGQRFILTHGRQLFSRKEAEELRRMGHFIAAADANPALASTVLRRALQTWTTGYQQWDRGRALAAMFEHGGDAETDFIVQTFYASRDRGERYEFIQETQRRKPKQWRKTLAAIVHHANFEHLDSDGVSSIAFLLDEFTGTKVMPEGLRRGDRADEVRKVLRDYFAKGLN